MIIKWIEYQNLMKSGNQPVKIEFDSDGSTALITGENGSGKSQILDALMLAWYGCTHRSGVNQKDLINRTNKKNLLIRSLADCGGKSCLVEYGESPKVRKLTIDNEEVKCPKGKKWDQFIIEETHQIPKDVFLQTSIIGKSNYTPFLSLTLPARRELIENIFSLEIFSLMLDITKKQVSENEKQRNLLMSEIGLLQRDSVHIKEKIQDSINRSNDRKVELELKIKENKDFITTVEKFINDLGFSQELFDLSKAHLTDINQRISKLNNSNSKCLTLINQTQSTIFELQNSLTQKNCPTCGQNLDVDITGIESKITELSDKLVKLKQDNQTMNGMIEEANNEHKTCSDQINDLNAKNIALVKAQTDIQNTNNFISQLENEIKNLSEPKQIQGFENELKVVENEIKTKEEKRENLVKKFEYLDHIKRVVLSDNGIKSFAIQQFVPKLQENINNILRRYDLEYAIQFKSDFSVSIIDSLGNSVNAETFSEGQKQRVNLSLWAALNDMIKSMRNVQCNILIFDEVLDGSLDAAGREEFIQSLNARVIGNNVSAFIISHFNHSNDSFSKEISVSIVDGFSHYVEA